MRQFILISHPEVIVDPALDVRRWGLSDAGRARMTAFAASAVVADVGAIWSSDETKAVEAAHILGARLGLTVQRDADLGENDRSATGFLPRQDFEAAADAFFAQPNASMRGWERAVDAQRRMAQAVDRAVQASAEGGDIAVVAHGAVGSLLLCHWLGQPISRAADQPFQGHYWRAALPERRVRHGWRSIAPRA